MSDDAEGPSIEIPPEAMEKFMKQVQEFFDEKFKECKVVIDCPYALAVEYGTTPSKKKGQGYTKLKRDPQTGKDISEVKLKIRDWIAEKEGLSGKERVKKGDAIYHELMEEGAAPHPYIRPAVQDALHTSPEDVVNRTSEKNLAMAYPMYIADRMAYYLKQNKSDVSHALKDSISVQSTALADVHPGAVSISEIDLRDDKYHWKPGRPKR